MAGLPDSFGGTLRRRGKSDANQVTVTIPVPSTVRVPVDDAAEPASSAAHSESTPVLVEEIGPRTGLPICFLNGLLGVNEHWYDVSRTLAARTTGSGAARCLIFGVPLVELRSKDLSVDGVTRLVSRVIEEVVGGPAIIAGNSLGGHVAQRIAMERPELCKALILAGSSGLFERTLERGVEHRPSFEWTEKKIKGLFFEEASIPPGTIERAYEELSKRYAARAIVKLGRSAKADHMGDRIIHIRKPTLLIWGRQDNVTPPQVAEEFHELIPDNRLVWVDRCGHAPMIERPQEFAEATLAFLDELEGVGPGPSNAERSSSPPGLGDEEL